MNSGPYVNTCEQVPRTRTQSSLSTAIVSSLDIDHIFFLCEPVPLLERLLVVLWLRLAGRELFFDKRTQRPLLELGWFFGPGLEELSGFLMESTSTSSRVSLLIFQPFLNTVRLAGSQLLYIFCRTQGPSPGPRPKPF